MVLVCYFTEENSHFNHFFCSVDQNRICFLLLPQLDCKLSAKVSGINVIIIIAKLTVMVFIRLLTQKPRG